MVLQHAAVNLLDLAHGVLHGILNLKLPKSEKVKPKTIEVTVG